MKRIDAWDVDGRLLQLLVAVADARSVTGAAERLALTQSAVSHGIERLRQLSGDALVVKAGRGIALTPRAEALAQQARELLEQLQHFAAAPAFVPDRCEAQVHIAANPLQRDLLLPRWFSQLKLEAPGLRLRVTPSDVPTAERLRSPGWHLAISPRAPDDADIRQEALFDDHWCVFYDRQERAAPQSLEDYLAAEHVTVRYESGRSLDIDRFLAERGHERRFAVDVAEFSGVAPFIRGSRRLATLPSLTRVHLMQGLAACALPVPSPPLPMRMIWHQRFDDDAMHRWLRAHLRQAARALGEQAAHAVREQDAHAVRDEAAHAPRDEAAPALRDQSAGGS
ncbi:MAG: LysR family transcriptional regulator [Rubrivivax sp.]|nr:LysR family transcriptional regulator [Rubrivivax sp.]